VGAFERVETVERSLGDLFCCADAAGESDGSEQRETTLACQGLRLYVIGEQQETERWFSGLWESRQW